METSVFIEPQRTVIQLGDNSLILYPDKIEVRLPNGKIVRLIELVKAFSK